MGRHLIEPLPVTFGDGFIKRELILSVNFEF